MFWIAVVVGAVAAVVAMVVVRTAARQRHRRVIETAHAEAKAAVRGARLEAAALRRAAETAAREEALEQRALAEDAIAKGTEELARRQERAERRAAAVDEDAAEVDRAHAELDARQDAAKAQRQAAQEGKRRAAERHEQARAQLEGAAQMASSEMQELLTSRWLEEAQAEAAARLRGVDLGAADPSYDRAAKRFMDIASGRYKNHFLTERNRSTLRVGEEICQLLQSDGGRVHQALEHAANIALLIGDDGDAIRLDGLDGVGREVARRALTRLGKRKSQVQACLADPQAWAGGIRSTLEQEIRALGKKAFAVLQIPKAHDEIVDLVGALNYRTSYTQNQWLHAVEASFLGGMIAAEMGLDVKLARRATLMHDIGKALTHKIEGSHAVIGADIARRLGEDEIIANAIGAHHADEPPSSVYAYLVAAADAMSGARPGARREATEGFGAKLDDLERIGAHHRGVERAHAVHGGRELRVYVREKELSDLDVVELSSDIAAEISEQMTFPGQIKVTVIRAYEAVATAS